MMQMQAVRYVHPVRKRRALRTWSHTLCLLIVLLLILLLVSCYLHALLQAVNSAPSPTASVRDEGTVCVRKEIERCEFYPCEQRGRVINENILSPQFGYAGRFVRRVNNITKPIPECESRVISLITVCVGCLHHFMHHTLF